ncbi:MAG TPA: AI-2E family transporter, partial [Gemmatimonadaceae bacterium]|nr:AI-2E family transporter [Gemmatimonadaceae bacterium]
VPPNVRQDIVNPVAVLDVARTTVRGIASVLTTAFLVLIILIFMLAEASAFPAKIRTAIGRTDVDLGRYLRIVDEVQRFLGIKTLTSLMTGTLIGLWTWMLGIDFPLLWGLVAFLFNYIPAIGSVVAAIPAIMLALVQFGFSHAIIVATGYLAVNVGIGNLLEPNLMGRRLGLSALVVVLSLIFWGFVLGPVGMFLSVPLTVMVKIMLENTDEFRWVAVLLDSGRDARAPTRPEKIEEPALVRTHPHRDSI